MEPRKSLQSSLQSSNLRLHTLTPNARRTGQAHRLRKEGNRVRASLADMYFLKPHLSPGEIPHHCNPLSTSLHKNSGRGVCV